MVIKSSSHPSCMCRHWLISQTSDVLMNNLNAIYELASSINKASSQLLFPRRNDLAHSGGLTKHEPCWDFAETARRSPALADDWDQTSGWTWTRIEMMILLTDSPPLRCYRCRLIAVEIFVWFNFEVLRCLSPPHQTSGRAGRGAMLIARLNTDNSINNNNDNDFDSQGNISVHSLWERQHLSG